MANKKISNLSQLSDPQGTDILPITDISDTTGSAQGTTKRVSLANIVNLTNIGNLRASNNLNDLADAGTARTNLGVDVSGTDNSNNVSFASGNDYLTIDAPSQTITRHLINLGTHVTGNLPNAQVAGLGSLATANGVDGSAVTSTGETGGVKFLREDGDGTCSFQPATADVEGPLTIALRGTDNVHIGAFPNQSFKVTDNPHKSVMVIASQNGDLDFLVNNDLANIYLNTPSARKSASFGFSVVEDPSEPDIEVESGGENYSVISGDSDSLGGNGLPIRQGFNLTDIGANSASLLISGGSIS